MMRRRAIRKAVRRAYGITWWEWQRFTWSRENLSYQRARKQVKRQRARFVADVKRRRHAS